MTTANTTTTEISEENGELRVANLVLRPQTRDAERDGEWLCLTEKEFALLYVLASHPRRTFTRAQLYREVWGRDDADTRTMTVHMHRLRQKVDREGTWPRRLRTVWGVGYRFEP